MNEIVTGEFAVVRLEKTTVLGVAMLACRVLA
jgi:hypothetical protein